MSTVRLLQRADGTRFLYHAHQLADGTTAEIVAAVPNAAALATVRDALPGEMVALGAGRMIDLLCPDPTCGAASSYPADGDPDAQAVHADVAAALEVRESATSPQAVIEPQMANAAARAEEGLDGA